MYLMQVLAAMYSREVYFHHDRGRVGTRREGIPHASRT